ncbi:hypothetical protein [Treponema sp. Marseille-Q3903]|uniref:hypothetical protein n=1 Tax=Treponema sp. Marseille-Q3903 TaxID=2766703 RepID=UPI0016523ED9|nr:hypothetical protein [Treponema sp. Marseille-Q3903]MBC6713580.1 hypothetical protein [Treponema sp. Marseille-Q3903]
METQTNDKTTENQNTQIALEENKIDQTDKGKLPVKKNLIADVKLPVKPQQELIPYEKENYSTIEKAIIELREELSNITELKEAIAQSFEDKSSAEDKFQENVTSSFNSLRQQLQEFNEKFNREIDYTRELNLKIKKNELEGQVYLLQRELTEERASITKTLDEISKLTKTTLQSVDDKCKELKTADNIIQEAITKFRIDSSSASENEYKALKANTLEMLKDFTDNAQKTLEVVKKLSKDFISQCEKENKNLISKVPGIKGKLSVENWIVLIFGSLGIASMIIKLIIK